MKSAGPQMKNRMENAKREHFFRERAQQ